MQLAVDRDSPLALHDQLVEQLRQKIDTAELKPGDELPTIKAAAARLGINANTVAGAYRTLEREGYVTQRKRAGTTVAVNPPRNPERSLATFLAVKVAREARAAGVEGEQLARAVAAQALQAAGVPRLRIGVLAERALAAAELANRVTALFSDGHQLIPVTPESYRSVDYHLTIIQPELTARLRPSGEQAPTPEVANVPPPHLRYGPEFPAGSD